VLTACTVVAFTKPPRTLSDWMVALIRTCEPCEMAFVDPEVLIVPLDAIFGSDSPAPVLDAFTPTLVVQPI